MDLEKYIYLKKHANAWHMLLKTKKKKFLMGFFLGMVQHSSRHDTCGHVTYAKLGLSKKKSSRHNMVQT